MTKIVINYLAVDGFASRKVFTTIKGARKYAQDRIGKNPEIGSGYAVSGDGVGRIVVYGCKLADLFGDETSDKPQMVLLWNDGDYDRADEFAPIDECELVVVDADSDEYGTHLHRAYVRKVYGPFQPEPDLGSLFGCVCSEQQLRHVGCDCVTGGGLADLSTDAKFATLRAALA